MFLSCCNNTSAAQNIAAPCLICRRWSRITASQFDGLLFALSSLRRFRTAIKSPEVCCTLRSSSFVALAVVLHFCSSHTNKHSGKKKKKKTSVTLSEWRQPCGNLCICGDAVEVGSVTAANPRVIRPKHSLVKKTRFTQSIVSVFRLHPLARSSATPGEG